ncbi:hypothetical protein G9A89_012409 [Geosiphon pyriformis]|nr:hypothetical protein G9A89_012409 [Geosiphon pyriformis]
MLRKTITDKQFSYLVSVVFQSIVNYRMQISYVSLGVCYNSRLLNKKDKILDWKTFWQWKRLDLKSPVPYWFILTADFMSKCASEEVVSASNHVLPMLNVLDSEAFACVYGGLLEVWSNYIEAYMDGSLKGAGMAEVTSGAAAYFPATDMDIGVRVQRLLLFTLAELQAIALVLECIFSSCSVVLYSDSQSVIDACVLESLVITPDFHN